MFVIEKVNNNNVLLDHFHVYTKKTSFKIFPNLGASLQEITVDDISVLNGIEISEEGVLDYQNSYKSSLLFPFPGRIENGKYTHNQKSFQLKSNESNRRNAIHGLVYDQHFAIDKLEATKDKAQIVLSYVSNGKLYGFPFEFRLLITYVMTEDSVQLNFHVENLGQDSFPFGIGWHPYFESNNLKSSSLTFYSNKQLICDENQIPKTKQDYILKPTFDLDDKFFDDCFILSNKMVRFKTEKYSLEMKLGETADAFLQLFTPSEKNSIAIEPMTCSPNVFNSEDGLKVLQPGETFHWQVDVYFKKNE